MRPEPGGSGVVRRIEVEVLRPTLQRYRIRKTVSSSANITKNVII